MTNLERETVNDLLRVGRETNDKLRTEKKTLILTLRNLVTKRTTDSEQTARVVLEELDK